MMLQDLNKAALVEEFLNLDRDGFTIFIDRLFDKLDRFKSHINFDKDLENMYAVLMIWRIAPAKLSEVFGKCQTMAQPLFAYMRETSDWSFFDITILSYVIRYAETIEEAIAMTDKALDVMDAQYSQEDEYWDVRWAIQCNMVPRIVQARHFGKEDGQPEADMDMLKEVMERYSSYALEVAQDYGVKDIEYMTLLRIAIFEGSYPQIKSILESIGALDQRASKGLYAAAMDELMLYHRLLGRGMNREILWRIMGRNVRVIREAAGMKMTTLANLVGIDPTYLAHMERGNKGFRCLDIYHISHVLNTDIGFFFFGNGLVPEEAPQTDGDKHVLSAIKGFSESRKHALARFLETEGDNI